jgi:hypothetical protein
MDGFVRHWIDTEKLVYPTESIYGVDIPNEVEEEVDELGNTWVCFEVENVEENFRTESKDREKWVGL